MLRTASVAAGLVLLAGCKPPPHPVERVEVVAASLAEAQLLALTPAQAQAELSERLVPERGFRLLGQGKREGDRPVRLTLEVDAVQEQSNASGLPGLEEVTASLGIRRTTDDGVERIVLQATRGQPVEGDALEGRQEAARRALDQVLDRLVQEARVHLDARKRDDARLTRDLRASDPLVRDAATLALVARRNRAAIPALVERLKGDDPLEVRRAIGGLVELQAREAVPELIEISRGRDPGFLRELVYALGAIGGDEAQAYLYTMSQGHDQPAVRDAARQALEEMNRHGRRPQEPLPRNAGLSPRRSPR
ncbi:MAG: HEAT repeat domain-containing protein [Myxococcaceae bacterium]